MTHLSLMLNFFYYSLIYKNNIRQKHYQSMRTQLFENNQIRRAQKRVFGKDITNVFTRTNKNQKIINQTVQSLCQKFVTVEKLQEPKQTKQIFFDRVDQYKKQIIEHMLSMQKKYIEPNNQNVTGNMRQILIDWIIDVHASFLLKQQTLHLALSYLNQFESKYTSTKQQYQLVGITCLWMASKYEQIYPLRMKSYIDVTAYTYTTNQMRAMQEKILEKLSFNLSHITLLSLLQASIKNDDNFAQIQKKSITFAKFILQIILIETSLMCKYPMSKLVSTVLMVCNSVFKTKFDSKKLQQMKNYSKEQIYGCYKQIVQLLRSNKSYGSDSIKRKYQTQKNYKVGKLKIQLKNQQKYQNE